MIRTLTLPNSLPEKRIEHYRDIEELISPGFLSHMVLLNGVPLSLRSPSPGDLYTLKHRIGHGFTAKGHEWRIWSLATCTWMVDGQSVLDNPAIIPKIAEAYRKLPTNVLNTFFTLFIDLYRRIERATRGVESYCYETYSRFLWFSYGKELPSDPRITGIPGTVRLGLNPIQKMWVYFNQVEDLKNDVESRWSNAKFVASAQNSKGVKQINSTDTNRRQREERDRQETHDKFYYWSIGLVDDDYQSDGFGLRRKKTSAELEDELKRWVAGEEDEHDKIVREYKEHIRNRYERERLEREYLYQQALERDTEEQPLQPSTRLVGYTPDQIEALMREKGLQPRVGGVKRISGSDHARNIYHKFIQGGEIKAPEGGWRVNNQGQLERPAQRDSSKSLDELIRDRKVQVEPIEE